ncbi:MAG: transposase [Muribaculaceae bacterium]|nr:transposase [Muribaculaceae bacterium]
MSAIARVSQGIPAHATTAVIDSQSIRTGLPRSVKGVDGGKKIKGIKRHLAVDSNGFPLTVVKSSANVHDSKGAIGLAVEAICKHPTVILLKTDNGYRGTLVKNLNTGLDVIFPGCPW